MSPWIGLWAAVTGAAEPPRGPDFDGDGFQDLAIGNPDENVMSIGDGGTVILAYGSADGLEPGGTRTERVYDHLIPGVSSEEHGRFGSALAWGDFDGDCFDDLAVGVPGFDVDAFDVDAGVVRIYYGGPQGLDASAPQTLHRDLPDVWGQAEPQQRFGSALAAGDFDGDDVDDLVVGVPNDGKTLEGSVHLFRGVWGVGLSEVDDLVLDPYDFGAVGDAGQSRMGTDVVAGDFDGDGRDDVAIGVPYAGSRVYVALGTASGLAPAQTHTYGPEGALGNKVHAVRMVSGDFDGNGLADLALGVPDDDWDAANAGGVYVLYGQAGGLGASEWWRRDTPGVDGSGDENTRLGWTLTAGRLDTDGYDDLAVTALEADEAGSLSILRGSAGGITSTSDVLWRRGEGPIIGVDNEGERFGEALTAGDFDGSGTSDLAIGLSRMDLWGNPCAGNLFELRTTATASPGVLAPMQAHSQENITADQTSEPYDQYALVMAVPRLEPTTCPVGGPGGLTNSTSR